MSRKRLSVYAFLIALFFISVSMQTPVLASEENIISVNLFTEKCYGTVSGQGKGSVFTSLPDTDPPLTISGSWKNGAFDGECTITYEDGTVQYVIYKKQRISGEVITEYPGGSRCVYSCVSGKPVGVIQYYNNNGDLTGKDWFHNSVPVQTLVENAIEGTYEDIVASPAEYVDIPVRLSGTVTSVFDSNNKCYLILADSQGNSYLLHYRNAEIKSNYASISVMENLSVGDSVTIYGLFENIRTLSNADKIYNSCYGYQTDFSELSSSLFDSSKLSDMRELFPNNHAVLNTPLPVLNAIFCETADTIDDPLHIPDTYENICRYPIYFIDQETDLTGTVLFDTFMRAKKTILRVVECSPGEYYIISEKSSVFSTMIGETVSVHGIRKGNKKLPYLASRELGYAVFPSIEAQ